jgi:hypothetical protein
VSIGSYYVQPGESATTISLHALTSAGGPSYGNMIDDVRFTDCVWAFFVSGARSDTQYQGHRSGCGPVEVCRLLRSLIGIG